MNLFQARYYPQLVAAAIVVILSFIYGELVLHSPILGRDDTLLIDPLQQIQSLREFAAYAFALENPDRQPVRDLSLFADVLLERATGFRTFHLQNLLIFFLSILGLHGLLQRLSSEPLAQKDSQRNLIYGLCLLFAVHPIFTMSVGWISARKHLLALLFLIYSLKAYLDWKKTNRTRASVSMLGLYFLSVLSQPIHIFLPLWWCLDLALSSGFRILKERKAVLGFGLIVCLSLLLWNYSHYAVIYVGNSEKLRALDPMAFSPLGDSLLALGRYTWNILVPLGYSLTYLPSAPQNLLGIFCFTICQYFLFSCLGWRVWLSWMMLSLFSLIIVLTKIPDLFVSDTYALGSVLVAYIFIFLILDQEKKTSAHERKYLAPLGFLLLVGFTVSSWNSVKMWKSDLALWQRTFAVAPDCRASENYAVALLRTGLLQVAREPIVFHVAAKCRGPVSGDLFSLSIFLNEQLSLPERERLLQEMNSDSEYTKLLLAALAVRKAAFVKARRLLHEIFTKSPGAIINLADAQLAPIAHELGKLCSQSSEASCQAITQTLRLRLSPELAQKLLQNQI